MYSAFEAIDALECHLHSDMSADSFENALQTVRTEYWVGARPSEMRRMYYSCRRLLCILRRDVEVMGERKIIPVNHADLEQYRVSFSSATDRVSISSENTADKNKQTGDGEASMLCPTTVMDYWEQLYRLFEEFYLLQNVSFQDGIQ